MAIVKSDYKKVETCLFMHKEKPNVFLLRKVIGSKYFTKVLTLEIRSGWSMREYKNEAKKELVKWLDGVTKQAKGLKFKDTTKVNDLFELWKDKKDTSKKSVASDIAFYETYLQDSIGKEIVVDVIAAQIDDIIHNLMHDGKFNKIMGKVRVLSKRTAYDNTRRILGEMFDIALRNQLIVVNPYTLLTKIAKTTRKTIVKDAVGKFYKLKTAILELYKDDPFWRGFFLFCLYGRRKGEVVGLKWENVDLENDVYYLIDTKNGNDYKKPLPFLVKEAIMQIPADRCSLVFASPKTGESIKNTDRQKMKLDKFVGFDDFKLHGTRHISGSALEELGANSDIIKDHLTHKRDGVTYKNYVTYDTYINSCKALELLDSIKEDYEF